MNDAIVSGFAIVGVSIALWTKYPAADDRAALCASPFIIFNACRQLRKPFAELLDTAPPPQLEQQVRAAASRVSGVMGLEKCHVRKVGFSYYVDLHIVVAGSLTVRRGHNIAHDVEDAVLQNVSQIEEVLVHVEPEEELLTPSLKR